MLPKEEKEIQEGSVRLILKTYTIEPVKDDQDNVSEKYIVDTNQQATDSTP